MVTNALGVQIKKKTVDEPQAQSESEDLSSLTKAQLLEKATELGVEGVSNSNTKDEIIAAIQTKMNENV